MMVTARERRLFRSIRRSAVADRARPGTRTYGRSPTRTAVCGRIGRCEFVVPAYCATGACSVGILPTTLSYALCVVRKPALCGARKPDFLRRWNAGDRLLQGF